MRVPGYYIVDIDTNVDGEPYENQVAFATFDLVKKSLDITYKQVPSKKPLLVRAPNSNIERYDLIDTSGNQVGTCFHCPAVEIMQEPEHL